jgi:hypothetical protein
MMPGIYVHALNITQRLALAEDNQLGHIRGFFDDLGFETEVVEDAVAVTIEWERGGWSWVNLGEYDSVKVN